MFNGHIFIDSPVPLIQHSPEIAQLDVEIVHRRSRGEAQLLDPVSLGPWESSRGDRASQKNYHV